MYEQFKPFVDVHQSRNRFFRLPPGEIEAAEIRLGYRFPQQLRSFFEEIGYGFLKQGKKDEVDPCLINRVIPPDEIAELLCDEENHLRPQGGFDEGEMPFFDLGDRDYLTLRPQSDNPHRVWLYDVVLAESVVEFFDKLYEQAGFYMQS